MLTTISSVPEQQMHECTLYVCPAQEMWQTRPPVGVANMCCGSGTTKATWVLCGARSRYRTCSSACCVVHELLWSPPKLFRRCVCGYLTIWLQLEQILIPVHTYVHIHRHVYSASCVHTHVNNILAYNCRYSVWQVQYTWMYYTYITSLSAT